MSKDYNLIMKPEEIHNIFKNISKSDIYKINTMKSQLQVTWKKLTKEDLELMEETIRNDINSHNSYLNLFGSTFGFIVTLAIGFIAAFVAFGATSNDETYKSEVFTLVTIVISLYIVLVATHYKLSSLKLKKNNKALTIIRVLKDIKKSEGEN